MDKEKITEIKGHADSAAIAELAYRIAFCVDRNFSERTRKEYMLAIAYVLNEYYGECNMHIDDYIREVDKMQQAKTAGQKSNEQTKRE